MRLFLIVSLAVPVLAQSPPSDPRVPRMVDDWVKQHPVFGATPEPQPVKTLSGVLPQAPAKPCSVPLIEMQLPKNVEFTMQQVPALKETGDHMQASVPAPPCPAR